MKKCMGCMRDYDEREDRCPVCGYSVQDMDECVKEKDDSLRAETILAGRYIIGRVLSYSEYAITYLAWDALLQKRTAIKEYLPMNSAGRKLGCEEIQIQKKEQDNFEQGMKAFEEECEILNHNQDIAPLVNVFRCIRENGTVYMVMEYLEGYTLQDYIEEHGKMSDSEATELLLQFLKIIGAMHSRGICHWNLSPDNIYLNEKKEVHLIDPGCAKKKYFYMVRGDIDIYQREFTAPELLLGRSVSQNADLYSLGAIYYFMVTGKKPKDGTLKRKRKDLKTGKLSQELILAILMKVNPEKRPSDVREFRERYEAAGKRRVRNGQKRRKE